MDTRMRGYDSGGGMTEGRVWRLEEFCFGQGVGGLVFCGEFRLRVWGPGDADGRVVPGDAAFVLWGVIVGCFVQEVCCFAQHHKTMRKAGGHPDLLVVVFAQFHTRPLAKGGGALTDVHRHVKHHAAHHAHQFALGLLHLVVQATQHTLGAAAVVVLHKVDLKPSDLVEVLLVEAFKKEAPRIAKDLRLEDEQVGDVGGGDGVGHGGA
jgi:hypothetical protein